jgi:uncharacterized protein YjbJ (UPF0337 family)
LTASSDEKLHFASSHPGAVTKGGRFGVIADLAVGPIGSFLGGLHMGFFVDRSAGFWGSIDVDCVGASAPRRACWAISFRRMYVMKWYEMASDWKRFTDKLKTKWGKLTDGDLTTFSGKRDQLASLLQGKYGYTREQAEREIDEFSGDLKV